MDVTVVGCAGSYPSATSPASSYLIQHDGFNLLLDVGNGSTGALQRHIGIDEVSAVCISHMHLDHCADLGSLYVARQYHPGGPRPRIPIYGPSDLRQRAGEIYGPDDSGKLTERFEFREFPGEPFSVGPFEVSAVPMFHCVEAYGFRVRVGDTVVAYSGDTAPCAALNELVKGADLAICEASFVESTTNPPGLHLTGREAAEAMVAGGARQLLLTHLVAWNDPTEVLADARDGGCDSALLAEPGLVFHLA